jgi:hypothetical protein
MGVSGGLYRLVLLLHILTVVVGFGGFPSAACSTFSSSPPWR